MSKLALVQPPRRRQQRFEHSSQNGLAGHRDLHRDELVKRLGRRLRRVGRGIVDLPGQVSGRGIELARDEVKVLCSVLLARDHLLYARLGNANAPR